MNPRRRTDIVIATAAAALGVVMPLVAARYADGRLARDLAPRLSVALGQPVAIGGVEVGVAGDVQIRGLAIGELMAFDEVDVLVDVERALSGAARVHEIRAHGGRLAMRVDAGGGSDLGDVLARARLLVRGGPTSATASTTLGPSRLLAGTRVVLDEATLNVVIDGWGSAEFLDLAVDASADRSSARVRAGRIAFEAMRGDVAIRARFGRAAADIDTRTRQLQRAMMVSGELELSPPHAPTLVLTGVGVTHGLDDAGDELLRVDGRVGQAGQVGQVGQAGQTGQAAARSRVSVRVLGTSAAPRLHVIGDEVPLAVLRAWSPRTLELADAYASGTADVALSATGFDVLVDTALRGITLDDGRVARQPMPLAGRVRASASVSSGHFDEYSAHTRRITISELTLEMAGLRTHAFGTMDYHQLAGGVARETWLPDVAAFSMTVPRTRCATALTAMPAAFRAQLMGLDLSGSMSARAELRFARATVDDTRLDMQVDVDECGVVRDADAADPRVIAGSPATRSVARSATGSATRSATAKADRRAVDRHGRGGVVSVSLGRLPKHLSHAFVVTEDARFFRHHGFDRLQIERSLAVDLHAGAFVRGGSTITQQLVKNAFLSHERTLARKFQEAVLTWRVEAVANKQQILERYLNLIELGPETYGVEAAARYWFGKSARRLGVRESAFLATLTPAPRTMSRRILEAGEIDAGTRERVDQVLETMRRHRIISERVYRKALRHELVLTLPAKAPPALTLSRL